MAVYQICQSNSEVIASDYAEAAVVDLAKILLASGTASQIFTMVQSNIIAKM